VAKPVEKVGVFIDAENLPTRTADRIFAVAGGYGRIVERRAYGDFTREMLRPWMEIVPHHALSLQTAPATISGKNSSDILLAIDVIEFLCRSDIGVFCIASTDSDFAHLASRLRMRGRHAIGLGGPKATDRFRMAFDAFFELGVEGAPPVQSGSPKVVALKQSADIRPYVAQALHSLGHNPNEWLDVARLASTIKRLNPEFQAKDFGSSKFSTVLKSCSFLEIQMHGTNGLQTRMRRQQGTG
jgi:hypothetical protein